MSQSLMQYIGVPWTLAILYIVSGWIVAVLTMYLGSGRLRGRHILYIVTAWPVLIFAAVFLGHINERDS